MNPRIETTNSYPVSIFIAGSYQHALTCAKAYCDIVGYCVTVTPTKYVYKNGQEDGVIIGLINYPRFPSTKEKIMDHAERLARILCDTLSQQSFSIQNPEKTIWYSFRTEDIISV
jgi:hypothetical protein